MTTVTNIFRSLFGLSLAFQMILATLLGIFAGLFFGELCSPLTVWGNAYILILKVTALPYLVCAIIHGLGRLSRETAKRILQKGAIFIGSAWLINIVMIYFSVSLFPTSKSSPFTSYTGSSSASINFSELLIPDNIFYALSNNIVPAVVVFCVLLGIALMAIREKKEILAALDTLTSALTRITSWIASITPIGTFLIIASQVGTMELSTVKQVSTYLILYVVTALILVFWIFPRCVELLTPIPAFRWIKALFPILLLGYTTNVVIVTLPFIIELIKKEMASLLAKDASIEDQIQGVVSVIFSLPLGSMFLALFVFFAAAFFQLHLSSAAQLQLFLTNFFMSLGAVGIGSWINSLSFLLDLLGIPLEAQGLYLSTLPFTAGFQSMISVIEVSSLSLFTVLACHGFITFKWKRTVKSALVTLLPLIAIASLLKAYNPLPRISNPHKSISQIELSSPVFTRVYLPGEQVTPRKGEVFERILSSKVLRVGYNPETIPFCFLNDQKELAGYDIAFAYTLAKDLGCSLELIPLHFDSLAAELKAGLYDVAMSSISITEGRLRSLTFSDPYQEGPIVFVMRKSLQKKISSIESLQNHLKIRIAVLKGSSYEKYAKELFPENRLELLDSYDQFAKKHSRHAVLLRGEPQAIAWTLLHPEFSVLSPKQPIGKDALGYAVSQEAQSLRTYLNLWLRLKRDEGFTEKQHDLWILGKTEESTPREKRWSILKDVL